MFTLQQKKKDQMGREEEGELNNLLVKDQGTGTDQINHAHYTSVSEE